MILLYTQAGCIKRAVTTILPNSTVLPAHFCVVRGPAGLRITRIFLFEHARVIGTQEYVCTLKKFNISSNDLQEKMGFVLKIVLLVLQA